MRPKTNTPLPWVKEAEKLGEENVRLGLVSKPVAQRMRDGFAKRPGRRKRKCLEKRFWESIEDGQNGCWEWVKKFHPNGYGRMSINYFWIPAHRAAWVFAFGEIPQGLNVLHKCDNPKCCNPNHLFLGSHADNVRDKVAKGRGLYGEKMPMAKLKSDQIPEIRRLCASGIAQRIVAKMFGVAQTTISPIICGKTWRKA